MSQISKYLPYSRAVYSYNAVVNGIRNVPTDTELKALQLMGEKIYDKVVEKFGLVFASSVFRSDRLVNVKGKHVSVNSLAGGAKGSGHTKGEAIDLDGDAPSATWVSVDNNVLFHWIRKNLVYDQLIAEFEANGKPKWVHASYRAVGNRQQTLIATKNSAGKTVYMNFTDSLYSKIYKGSRDRSFSLEDVFEMPDTDYQTFLAEGEGVNEAEVVGNKQRLEPEEEVILDEKEETLLGKGPLPVIEENKDGSFSLIVPPGYEIVLKPS